MMITRTQYLLNCLGLYCIFNYESDSCRRSTYDFLRTISSPTAFCLLFFFFFQAEDGIRDLTVTGVQTCALPISKYGADQNRMNSLQQSLALSKLGPRAEEIARAKGQLLQAEGAAAYAKSQLDATDRKSTRLNSSHSQISYAVFCLKKKKRTGRV